MNYQIRITRIAEQDLNDAADYIEFVLKNPIAADRLFDLAEEAISSLSQLPHIHPLVDDPVLRAWGIRYITVNNYLAFYTIDDSQSVVFIIRFLYGKRNWIPLLRQGINID